MNRQERNQKVARDIQRALHKTFTRNAIKYLAYQAQLEDIAYCTRHQMNHLNGGLEERKWYSLKDKYDKLENIIYIEDKKINSKMMVFKNRANKAVVDNDLYMLDVLERIPTMERYAVQSLLYPRY